MLPLVTFVVVGWIINQLLNKPYQKWSKKALAVMGIVHNKFTSLLLPVTIATSIRALGKYDHIRDQFLIGIICLYVFYIPLIGKLAETSLPKKLYGLYVRLLFWAFISTKN